MPTLYPVRPRRLATWTLAHGLPHLALAAAARRGDPNAGPAVDPRIRDDPFATYDRIRAEGPLATAR